MDISYENAKEITTETNPINQPVNPANTAEWHIYLSTRNRTLHHLDYTYPQSDKVEAPSLSRPVNKPFEKLNRLKKDINNYYDSKTYSPIFENS